MTALPNATLDVTFMGTEKAVVLSDSPAELDEELEAAEFAAAEMVRERGV